MTGSTRSSRRSSTPAQPSAASASRASWSRRGAARAHPTPDPRRGRGGPRRQPVSLRRLRADHRGGAGRSRRTTHETTRRATGRGAVGRPGRERGAAVSVGEPAPRVGGRARVTGEQQYVADLPHDDVLHVKLVALDVARARIGSIDTTAALRIPGVRLVTTAARLAPPDAPLRSAAPRSARARHRRDEVPRRARRRGRRGDPRRCRGGGGTRLGRVRGAARTPRHRAGTRRRRAARPGSIPPSRRPVCRHQRPPRAPSWLGRRRGRGRRPGAGRRRGHIRLPDGHPVRDRAPCLHGRPRRRRHRGLERDPAPVLAPARHRRLARPAALEGPRLRTRPRRGVRWQTAREVRAAARVHGARHGPARSPRAHARGNVPGRPPGSVRGPRPNRVPARRHDRLPRHRGQLPHRGVRRHRRPDRRQGQLHLQRPVPRAERPHPRSQRALSHRALDRVPRLRQPAADLGGRIEHERGGARARHRPARSAASEPRRTRRGIHPARHAGRWRLGPGRRAGGRDDRLADADTARSRSRHRGRAQVRANDRPVVLDGPPPDRRQRRRLRRHVRHGPGGPDDLCPDRRAGTGRTARLGDRRHGRHRGRAVRPADLGQPVVRADGKRRAGGLSRHPGEAPGDGRRPRGRRRVVGGDRGRRGPDRRSIDAHQGRRRARPRDGSVARSPASASRARRPSRTTRSAGPRRSTSSTRPRSRRASTATQATSRSIAT